MNNPIREKSAAGDIGIWGSFGAMMYAIQHAWDNTVGTPLPQWQWDEIGLAVGAVVSAAIGIISRYKAKDVITTVMPKRNGNGNGSMS